MPPVAQSMRVATHASASGARSGTGPTEPSPTPTVRASRSATAASPATEITMALRGPTFRYSCGPLATGMLTEAMSSVASRAVRFGPDAVLADRAAARCR